MIQKLRGHKGGFTLVEIMIVVAIIGLLAAIAVPSFLRARTRSQATTILNFCRVLESALDQYALENNKQQSSGVGAGDLLPYIKTLEKYGALNNATMYDVLNNPMSIGPTIADRVHVSSTTKTTLLGATGGDEFWGPYS